MSKQAVLDALADTPPTGSAIVTHQEVRTWSIEALPQSLTSKFVCRAVAFGESSQEFTEASLKMAANGVKPWEPALPLGHIADSCIEKAQKKRRALVPTLQRWINDDSAEHSECVEFGLRLYREAVGHPISERNFRRWIKLVLSRDGGAYEFERLELYLPKRPTPKPLVQVPSSLDAQFQPLADFVNSLADPTKATADQKALVWVRAFNLLRAGAKTKREQNACRREIVKFLFLHFGALAASEHALRVNFDRKYIAWLESEQDFNCLLDRREDNGKKAYQLPEDDRFKLIAAGAKLGGGVPMAWRLRHSELSEETRKQHPNKYKCPRQLMELILPAVKLEKDALKGAKQVRVRGAYVNRDPDGIASGDWDQSDDMTPVNYWWEESEKEPMGFWFGQGQWLPWIDERSYFIYHHVLVTDAYYDAFNIRNSWTEKAAEWGLPRCGLSLERGIWQRSRILVGRKSEMDPDETEVGLRRLGLEFHHFTEARGKVIEHVFDELQKYFQAIPGYAGRNQITDRYEGIQKKIRLVKSGQAHPADLGFLHKSEMVRAFTNICRDYNDCPKGGKYHRGLSPHQVFEKCFTSKVVHVPKELGWLIATDKMRRPVTGNGIRFSFGTKEFGYKSDELGQRINRQVEVYFNPARPETIFCTDLDGSNPFVCELEVSVANHNPPAGVLEKALRQNAAQNRYRRELHQSLRKYYHGEFFQRMFRPVMVSAETVENTREFARQNSEIENRKQELGARLTRARKAYSESGAAMPENVRPEALDAALALNQLRREAYEEDSSGTNPQSKEEP